MTITWRDTLGDLFAASVNEQTLEEAAEQMVFVSEDNPEYHDRYLGALDSGIDAARSGDGVVIALINRSGYHVSDTEAALQLLTELRLQYLQEYERATES